MLPKSLPFQVIDASYHHRRVVRRPATRTK